MKRIFHILNLRLLASFAALLLWSSLEWIPAAAQPGTTLSPSFQAGPAEKTPFRNMPGWPADSVSLPQSQYYYTWEEPGEWVLQIYSTFTYREDMLTDTSVNYYQEGGEPFNRIMYDYDTLRRTIGVVVQSYEGGFNNTSWFEYGYDDHGNRTIDNHHIWFSNTWKLLTGQRDTYSYNANLSVTGILREDYNVIQGYTFDERLEFDLNAEDEPTAMVTYGWIEFSWKPQYREHQVLWHSYDPMHAEGKFLQYQHDVSVNDEWLPDYRRMYVYTQYGSFEFVEQDYRGNDTWMNDTKYEESFNQAGLPIERKYYTWDQDTWKQTGGSKYEYTFDGIDLVEIITMEWDSLLSGYSNLEKLVFGNFIHFQSTPSPGLIEPVIAIFPVPASEFLHIRSKKAVKGMILLNDLHGRMVIQKPINGTDVDLDVSGLAPGLYYLQVFEGTRKLAGKKIIKQ